MTELDAADVTALFRLAYDVAIRRCDVCERCGKAARLKGAPHQGSN
jgi:hypothetical protein